MRLLRDFFFPNGQIGKCDVPSLDGKSGGPE